MTIIVGALGLALGLVSHDLAVQGLSEDRRLRPFAGSCPRCGHHRGWFGMRCPRCGRSLQREPVVALASAGVAVGFHHTVGFDWVLLPYIGFVMLTMALVVTDLEELRIVDRLNIPGSVALAGVLVVVALAGGDHESLLRGLAGAGAYFAGASILWLVVRGRGFGAGDVKLAPVLGLFTAYISWGTLGQALFATAMIGGVVALLMLAFGAARMKSELPYGPPMVLGSWLAIVMAGLGSTGLPS